MAVTGSGTQADPYIVHNYSEFISLSNTIGTTAYIQFFENENPNQVIDCNNYGSEFKWGAFKPLWANDNGKIYINLNGCTIKNLIIADGQKMFSGVYAGNSRTEMDLYISNGSIRNVFMGSPTSKFCGDYVELHDVSISINTSGSTVVPFDGTDHLIIDNCAIYLVASTLNTSLIKGAQITDTDIELHVSNQNNKTMFPSSTFTDCRITGKVSGVGQTFEYNTDTCVLDWCGMNSKTLNFTNCVVDLDLTDGRIAGYNFGGSKYDVFLTYNGTNVNTNVICNSHRPIDEGHEQYYGRETSWNFMSHENIRNGTYLNNAGFTVVEVVGS